jgi:hypothetical protein
MNLSYYKALDASQTHVLLYRHAARDRIIDFRTSTQALLTTQGKADARRLGSLMAGRFTRKTAFHSPVRRCAQTVEALIQGAAEKNDDIINGGVLSWLGGDFIGTTVEYVNNYMLSVGWKAFLRDWFAGKLPSGKILPLETVAPIQLEFIMNQLTESAGLVIDVTHDWNMMILLEHYFGLRFEEAGVPGYLDCIIASMTARGCLRLTYQDQTVEIAMDKRA